MSTPENIRRSERLKAKALREHGNHDEEASSSNHLPSKCLDPEGSGRSSTQKQLDSKKSKKSRSRVTESKRNQTELEIALKKKALEQEKLELEFRQKQEILDLELALRLAKIDEESSESSESNKGPDIEKWVRGEYPWENDKTFNSNEDASQLQMPKKDSENEQVRHNSIFSRIKSHNDDFLNENIPSHFQKFLTRQSMPKDLPYFSGNPTEWPNFLYQYTNSTAICGYSQEENHCRLQKCLRGTARKIVQSLLIMPQNVDKIMNILENRFGQPEQIIFMLLDNIKSFPAVKEDKLECLINFSDEVKNLVGTIESLKANDHLQNPILLQELLNKLPNSYKMMWIEHISGRTLLKFKLLEFTEWLDKKAMAACKIQMPRYHDDISFDNAKKSRPFYKKDVTMSTTTMQTKKCICCDENLHNLSSCLKFNSFSIDERWNFVKSKKICFNCLTPFHNTNVCRKKKICGINDCQKYHNKLLHKIGNVNSNYLSENVSTIPTAEVNCHISNNRHVLLKILPITISCNQQIFKTYALLDDASTVTLIDQDLADMLNMDGPQQPLCLQWTNKQIKEQDDSRTISFTVRSENGHRQFQLRHVRTMRGLSLPTQTVDIGEITKQYPYIDRKAISMKNAKPQILIGQDNWPLLVNRKLITGPWNGPALSKTLLGWVIHGNINIKSQNFDNNDCGIVCYVNDSVKDDLDLLHNLVKEQWTLDSFGLEKMEKPMSKEDIRAQEILNETMVRIGDGYETGLLWKDVNMILPESRNNAMKRLLCTERKIDKNPIYGKAYCDKMKDLLDKNYIRKLTREEIEEENSKTWYLPHFGITNPNKPDKLRIVFDASSKSNGISLNNCLLTGPDLYNSLFTILLNFRIKQFAFVADIKEMFLRVRVRKEDCAAQRILWRGMDRNRAPDVFEIGVVFFGSTNGPCLAQEAKNKNARYFEKQYPEAAKAIIEDHYMDDYLGNSDDIEEGKKLIHDIIYVHSKGNFTICNWMTNSDELLEDIDPKLKIEGDKNLGNNPETMVDRILGVFWNSVDDSFVFRTKFHKIDKAILENKRRPTKREILKVVMSIFDPIGFLSHFIIQGKILLQDIWRSKLGWDDEITDILNEKWQLWIEDLQNIFKFKMPRQYFSLDRSSSDIQIHIFCDASEKATATVAYLRCQQNEKIQIAFVSAKARVSSLKPISIPRLELQAALMGARLGDYLRKNLKLKFSNIFYWTDSKTVLYWIRSEARRFKVFVAQRLGEIHSLTNTIEWRYLPSKENVADEATKRNQNMDFSEESTWLYGPAFLKKPSQFWPQQNEEICNINENTMEERKDFVFLNFEKTVLPTPSPERFSKWIRLVRTTGWMLRFINICKTKKGNHKTFSNGKSCNENLFELDKEEISKSEELLYKKVQQDSFQREIDYLKQNLSLEKSSRLYNLSCKLRDDGLLVLKGRFDNLQGVSTDFKQPIILDPSHKITKLIIQYYHESVHHHGQETVLNNLRQKFWILRIRQAVKTNSRHCQYCKNKKVVPEIPIMGQLPVCRLEPTIRPFIKTGVDYFGPILVTVKRSHEKRYGVIFTCMVTRAVHLEIANDLSTNGFIHTLRQFGCRRGFPQEIYSDNGTNFKSAEKELAECLAELNQTEITQFCTLNKIRWKWNPPVAPHMGGVWERLIQSVKKVMNEILKSRYPQEYVLRTVFAETENIINSRPLTHVSLDSDDSEALTPNHFLIGPEYAALPCSVVNENDLNLLSKWKASQKLADIFWKRWTHEYMPHLIKRTKWFKESRSIQENDIVIIVDSNGPRNTWPKGRVIKLFHSRDGKIRIVDVKLANGTVLRRPVSRLCVLDVQKE